jgi:predicted nucleotidyltransferase
MKEIVALAVDELKKKYQPHTIIMYGSYARNEETETSDLDIAGFCDKEEELKDARLFHGIYLDAWIHPTSTLENVSDASLCYEDGVALYDERGLGKVFIEKVKALQKRGTKPMASDDLSHLKQWVNKMLERAANGDIDGNYRRTWLQFDLLKMYFDIRGLWFLGHKKSFQYLQKNDAEGYRLFEAVYSNPEDIEALRKLAVFVVKIQG